MKRILCHSILGVIGAGLMGCSFSVSAGNVHTLHGNKILVEAKRPAPPPKPKPKPRKAKVVENKIEITEKVMFEYDSATIQEVSYDLLNDVASVIKEHPNIKKIRVEGHTDADGTEEYNKDLSQRRAQAVVDFLVQAGVEPERLEPVGYGEERPIADNDTEEGKEKNRRVEFNIIEQ